MIKATLAMALLELNMNNFDDRIINISLFFLFLLQPPVIVCALQLSVSR